MMIIDPVVGENYSVELSPENIRFVASLTGWKTVYDAVIGKWYLWSPERFGDMVFESDTEEGAWGLLPPDLVINDTATADRCIHMIKNNGVGRRAKITDAGAPFLGGDAQIKIELDELVIEEDMPVSVRRVITFAAPTYEQAAMKLFIGVAPIIRNTAEIIQKFTFALNLEHHVQPNSGELSQ